LRVWGKKGGGKSKTRTGMLVQGGFGGGRPEKESDTKAGKVLAWEKTTKREGKRSLNMKQRTTEREKYANQIKKKKASEKKKRTVRCWHEGRGTIANFAELKRHGWKRIVEETGKGREKKFIGKRKKSTKHLLFVK